MMNCKQMYQALVITNYFMFKYNMKGIDPLEQIDVIDFLGLPN